MTQGQSALVEAVGRDWWGITEATEIEVADNPLFLDRYTEIVALGNTMMQGNTTILGRNVGLYVRSVSPWHPEIYLPENPRALSQEEAQEKVQAKLRQQAREKAFDEGSRVHRVVEVLRALGGRESGYSPMRRTYFPDVLDLKREDGSRRITIDAEVEAWFVPSSVTDEQA